MLVTLYSCQLFSLACSCWSGEASGDRPGAIRHFKTRDVATTPCKVGSNGVKYSLPDLRLYTSSEGKRPRHCSCPKPRKCSRNFMLGSTLPSGKHAGFLWWTPKLDNVPGFSLKAPDMRYGTLQQRTSHPYSTWLSFRRSAWHLTRGWQGPCMVEPFYELTRVDWPNKVTKLFSDAAKMESTPSD